MADADPQYALADAVRRATGALSTPLIGDPALVALVVYVARSNNRAGVRLLLACALAKTLHPHVDIRKPYTEIEGTDSYSGRYYDETYIGPFINEYDLPANPTTAFLTPALRTKNRALLPGVNLGGSPPQLYENAILLLNAVEEGRISAADLLAETIRALLASKEEKRSRLAGLLAALRATQAEGTLPLSSEGVVKLIAQHMASPNASRLPVLIVAAAYRAAQQHLGERVLALHSHNAADEQTGSLGDVEITLEGDDRVIIVYEMKMKRVMMDDINRALQKIGAYGHRIDSYIFITTDVIEETVEQYASEQYTRTGGMEMAILDAIGFLRHFLHLFHRLRIQFLETYQELLIAEPESAVRQELKETFLTLRRAAETGNVQT
jgi:DNA adenine methylase